MNPSRLPSSIRLDEAERDRTIVFRSPESSRMEPYENVPSIRPDETKRGRMTRPIAAPVRSPKPNPKFILLLPLSAAAPPVKNHQIFFKFFTNSSPQWNQDHPGSPRSEAKEVGSSKQVTHHLLNRAFTKPPLIPLTCLGFLIIHSMRYVS